jgi:DNA primase
MDEVEEIKQKLDIVAVIQEYVPLKKAGVSWKGCCPFHNEKSPSFFVHTEKNFWHCFGCNEGGDIFTFIQKMEKIEFAEALKILAQKAGVELKKYDPRITDQKNRLQDICEMAAKFWQNCLIANNAAPIRAYVQERKISDEAVQNFKLGYAQESWDSLLTFLLSRGFTETEIFQAGLIVKKENGNGYYDRFRHRLMFPIQDLHGNVVGFTGRALKKEELAKYVNTPESRLYHKGEILYALDKAKNSIREKDYVIIVEGNMDALACHQAGYTNVVACSGTALTPIQIKLLKRYTNNIVLTLDIDEAGQNATQRTIDLLFNERMNIKIVNLTVGKDPDECLKTNPAAWIESLRKSKPIMQFYLDRYLTADNLRDIYKKQTAIGSVLSHFSKLENKVEQDHWLRVLANVADVREDFLLEELKRVSRNKPVTPALKPAVLESKNILPPVKTKEVLLLERILTIIMFLPELVGYVENFLTPEMIEDESLRAFYKSLIILYYKNKDNINRESLLAETKKNLTISQSYFDSLTLYVDKIYEGFSPAALQAELRDLVKKYQGSYWDKVIKEKQKQLVIVEREGNVEEIRKIMNDIQLFSQRSAELK